MLNPKTNSNGYILAVDDIPDNLLLVKYTLESEGHQIVMVGDGASALAKIEQSPPDLILLDVMMPEMDGYEVTRRIRNHPKLPYIPILLITAHEQSSVVKGLDEGADDFLRKPIQIDELQARVRSLLRLKHSIDQRENFVRCLTHDLRTPLVAANRMLRLMKQKVFGEISKDLNEAVDQMMSNNESLLKMLNNLLAVYSYDMGRKTLSFVDFNLEKLIHEIVTELSPLATEKGLSLDCKSLTKTNIRKFKGDRIELRRVLTNLLGNAIKFTDRGKVEVLWESTQPPVNIHQSDQKTLNSDWIKIKVKDTGMGIPVEEQATIFEAFCQGNHKRSGNGLGLHLCRQVIEAHQGTISVDSQPGQGTVFTICLPVNHN
ncbi:MAG: hybrid sensor histidine kinase/response regulator [Microcoleaceae cyanobacterium]